MKVYSVGELTSTLRVLMEREFPFCWVRGQVSNLSRPSSGHIYFSLKDAEASLHVVWFKQAQRVNEGGVDPLTGEWKESSAQDLARLLNNGMELLCGGGLGIYGPRGQYQLAAEFVEDAGMGRLHLEFEALKRRFDALGWFTQDRKRPLAHDPSRVAVITSPTGAAWQDFLRLAQPRGTGATLKLYPALMQGDSAPADIASAMRQVANEAWAQIVVLIRGGGSLEDLWAFNTEPVAHAVAHSPIPVVAGIGHEVDTTLADMIADVRAATPSHAAQLLWPERRTLMQGVDELETAMQRHIQRRLEHASLRLESCARSLRAASPGARLELQVSRCASLADRLQPAISHILERAGTTLESNTSRLQAAGEKGLRQHEATLLHLQQALEHLDPHAPLKRGYALAASLKTGRLLRSVNDVCTGEAVAITLADGRIEADVTSLEGTPHGS